LQCDEAAPVEIGLGLERTAFTLAKNKNSFPLNKVEAGRFQPILFTSTGGLINRYASNTFLVEGNFRHDRGAGAREIRRICFGADAVDRYIEEAKALGFDVIEISAGFISLPTDSLLRLVEKVKKAGLKAKPEIGIQFGAGGATAAEELERARAPRTSAG
jgi:hypothetical protein